MGRIKISMGLESEPNFWPKSLLWGFEFFPLFGVQHNVLGQSMCRHFCQMGSHLSKRVNPVFGFFVAKSKLNFFFSCTHIINSVSGYLTQYVAVSSHTYDLSYYAVWALGRGGRKNLCCYLTRIVRKKKNLSTTIWNENIFEMKVNL